MSDDNAHARSIAEQLRLAEENDNLPEEIAERHDLDDDQEDGDDDVDQDDSEVARDVCPDCGFAGEFLGESVSGGPSVGVGSPNYTEHWRCRAENCDTEWSA